MTLLTFQVGEQVTGDDSLMVNHRSVLSSKYQMPYLLFPLYHLM